MQGNLQHLEQKQRENVTNEEISANTTTHCNFACYTVKQAKLITICLLYIRYILTLNRKDLISTLMKKVNIKSNKQKLCSEVQPIEEQEEEMLLWWCSG